MLTINENEGSVEIETDRYQAKILTEGYVTGVGAESFVDKRTGAKDLGFGLCIVDFLLEPGINNSGTSTPPNYRWGDLVHGQLPKRYVELPQICTKAKKLPFEIVKGKDFVALKQWFNWDSAQRPYRSGSLWEQWLVFPNGVGWFFAYDKVTSVNSVDSLVLRMDMPSHIKHKKGDSFKQIYLSYHGYIAAKEFEIDFAPDTRYLYQRTKDRAPERFIRAYQLNNGYWLAGMTLDPSIVYEAWCHQRSYVCMIQEIGGWPIKSGESFGVVNLIGFFENVGEMEQTFDQYQGINEIQITKSGWHLQKIEK